MATFHAAHVESETQEQGRVRQRTLCYRPALPGAAYPDRDREEGSLASLYLDDAGEEIMAKALGAIRQAGMSIWLHLPENEFPGGPDVQRSYTDEIRHLDWQFFSGTCETAVTYLRAQLNPRTLEEEARSHSV